MSMWHPDMPPEERAAVQEYNRRRYLPRQMKATVHKLIAISREARRYGDQRLVDEAWETLLNEAQEEAFIKGGSIGFGDGKR